MSIWNAASYLTFSSERTRAAFDLAARIPLRDPATIADLGCGPGNSTQILRQRWPDASILGIDNSPQMVEAAEQEFPDQNWLLADLSEWTPDQPVDLIYSNAALQWLPNHQRLIPRLFALAAPGGVLAFQIPSSTYALIRQLIHEVSRRPVWSDRLEEPRNALTMEPPAFYYDALVSEATDVDLWETEYLHVLNSSEAVIDWIASTGLRPFLAALKNEAERDSFLTHLRERVNAAYETRRDGKVLFPFRRTFVIAYR